MSLSAPGANLYYFSASISAKFSPTKLELDDKKSITQILSKDAHIGN